MSAISQSGLLHSALGREKSQCRSIVNNFQCRQCSSHLLLTIQISRVVEKLKGRERAASGWAGLSCDARQPIALAHAHLGKAWKSSTGAHCACSIARVWLTHTCSTMHPLHEKNYVSFEIVKIIISNKIKYFMVPV